MSNEINIIGGGLAGVEAAWQAAELGAKVRLYEMRPLQQTPAHRTDKLAEIVCSNSLKTDEPGSAPYLLKEELRRGGSLVMEAAAATRVPAGSALSVDRIKFAEYITEKIEAHPNIEIIREEVTSISEWSADTPVRMSAKHEDFVEREITPRAPISSDDETLFADRGDADRSVRAPTIIATGPLTSEALTADIMRFTGDDQLYFYDAIAPIIAADSIDMSIAFKAARYDKGGDDYINCPMDREQYEHFIGELLAAKSVPLKRFEETHWFESCLPIEEIARRGPETLRFGPMKPKGLRHPKTGEEPYACVQLRQENLMADAFGMVGFQNHLRYGEQERVLRLIPAWKTPSFSSSARSTATRSSIAQRSSTKRSPPKSDPHLFFAGQITGVEGYVESVATGWLAGINAVRTLRGEPMITAPANLRHRRPLPLRLKCRNKELPARQHHLRPPRTSPPRPPQKAPQKTRTPHRPGRTGAQRLGRVYGGDGIETDRRSGINS
jgi:methylenetetrahydrofolate--tRNA-(uracil-5-)-methyltransferase